MQRSRLQCSDDVPHAASAALHCRLECTPARCTARATAKGERVTGPAVAWASAAAALGRAAGHRMAVLHGAAAGQRRAALAVVLAAGQRTAAPAVVLAAAPAVV